MLKRISKKFGFTRNEIKILLFILIVFAGGFIYKTFFIQKNETPYQVFDYSEEDEKYYNSKSDSIRIDSLTRNPEKQDYKDEVLSFSDKNFNQFKKKTEPAPNSINLNTAGYSDLVNLPGVGEKTAAGIIELRKKLKKFTRINQLLDVKGIGESKLNKIKKYVYIN